ncbi:P2Y purinoceptor 11-like [Trichomycterus rosablanca]|uniref:P2Y purinoceptor 11-like n=1 Tax=Trichomycterus rosablanca TaxID=2290929 RepID=UPI002F352CF2
MTSHCNDTFQTDLLPPIYGVELCVALVGNIFALVLLIIKERKNWHTGVVFFCNLAISDILYVLTLPLLIDYYSKECTWNFGITICKIERFLFNCNMYVSIYFIMCISVNRYLAIAYPFFTRNCVRPKHAKIISVLVWIFVAIMSSPILYFAGVDKNNQCSLFADQSHNYRVNSYRWFMAVMGCLLPFIVTFASYVCVILVVFKNANITTLEKKKVALIVGVVCVLYAIFVPYHILQLWEFYLRRKDMRNCSVSEAYQTSKALACLNMCLHPILYLAVSDGIRTMCCRRSSDE